MQLELILNFSTIPHLAKRLKEEKSPHANIRRRRGREKKLLMDVLCVMQSSVVKAARPNIYDEEHTIMNNACYGRTAQRIHGPVSSLQIGRSMVHYTVCYCARSLACIAAVV